MAQTFLLTGATGSVGKALVRELAGANIRVLARSPEAAERALPGIKAFRWQIGEPVPAEAARGADAIIHLAGVPIAEKRLTAARMQEIHDSRVVGTRAMVEAAKEHGIPALVCASAVGIYEPDADAELGEDARQANSPLANVCKAWEAEAVRAESFGTRVVRIRIGIVLDTEAGALGKVLPLFKLGLGGPLSSGKQWMPWIHVQDVAGLFAFAATHHLVHGVLNASAPHPVTNNSYTEALARAVNRPAVLRVPGLALRVALGELGNLALMSQRMVPKNALAAGFTFRFPTISGALDDLLRHV